MAYLGIALVVLYIVALLFAAYRGSKATKEAGSSSRSFFLGNGSGTLVILFSIVASGGSAWLFQGGPAAVYSNGISYLAICVIWSLTYYVLYGYFAPRGYALGKYHGFVTLGEMYEKFYSSRTLAFLIAVIQICALIPSCIAQTRGMGLAINILSGGIISTNVAIIISAIVVVLYCTAGGFGSLSRVDTIQGIMFTVIIWVGLIAVFVSCGLSVPELFDVVEANNPSALLYPTDSGAYWALGFALTYSICQAVGNLSQPILWQRFFAAKSGQHLKLMARFLAPVYGILVLAATLLVGLFFNAFDLTGISADNAFQTLMGNINPVFGLIVGMGIIAAAMSTAAGAMFTASSVATMNIIRTFKPEIEDAKLSKIGKLIIVILAVVAVSQAVQVTTPLSQLAIVGISLYTGGVFPLAGMFFWKRATTKGCCAGVATMLVTAIYFYWINPNFMGLFSGIWPFICGLIVFIVVSLCTKPIGETERLDFMRPIMPTNVK